MARKLEPEEWVEAGKKWATPEVITPKRKPVKPIVPDAFKKAFEAEMKAAMEDRKGLATRVFPESPLWKKSATIPIKKAEPEVHRSRYPVYTAKGDLHEHEVRFMEGDNTVEVWEGVKMVCAIPLAALQHVLMNELLDHALFYEDNEEIPEIPW